ncbi:MAG: Nudix family hydrolase [Acidiferrobacterales bacterium]
MPNTAAESVHVVVGVVCEGERVLIAQRPVAAHQGGKWEFPGGKIMRGEATRDALARELVEEIGIRVHAADPLIQVRHVYPDKTVFLDVWRVTQFEGRARGREGQPVAWMRPDELTNLEMPAANRPIVQALRLPSLYLITDSQRFGPNTLTQALERALTAGVRLVQLREPRVSERDYLALAARVADLCHQHGARLLVNGKPQWVAQCGADGVHLNSQQLRSFKSRPLGLEQWVAASTHDAKELALAAHIDADFVVLSPVLRTSSHPHATPLGWPRFQALCVSTNLPVYALGGMRKEHLQQARAAGAQGLAMISGIWGARQVEVAVAAFV